MAFSRQFRALTRISLAFAGVWAGVGAAAAVLGVHDGDVLGRIGTYAVMYGALGAISGMVSALALMRAEAGRRIEEVATRRMAAWGAIGGLAPAALFALLGVVFGAPAAALVPLIGLGVVSAGVGGAVAASGAAVAKRRALAEPEEAPRLPAT